MTTVLVDYDSGNLHSAQKAFERMAREVDAGDVIVTSDPDVVRRADRIVLPGDGAFPHCHAQLHGISGLADAIVEAVEVRAVPFMGICVGMQMLALRGFEYEETDGFGWINAEIPKIAPSDPTLPVPHMGWEPLLPMQPLLPPMRPLLLPMWPLLPSMRPLLPPMQPLLLPMWPPPPEPTRAPGSVAA